MTALLIRCPQKLHKPETDLDDGLRMLLAFYSVRLNSMETRILCA